MELTRAILDDLLHSLRSNGRKGSEKRTQPRVGLRLRAQLFSAESVDAPVEIWLRDISAGGLGILAGESFAHGQSVKVILANADDDQLPCTVTYCRRVGPNLFQLGLKFQPATGANTETDAA